MLGLSLVRLAILLGYTLLCGLLVFGRDGAIDWGQVNPLEAAPWLVLGLGWLVLPVAILVFARGAGAITAVAALLVSLFGVWVYWRDDQGYSSLFLPAYQLGVALLVVVTGYAFTRWGRARD